MTFRSWLWTCVERLCARHVSRCELDANNGWPRQLGHRAGRFAARGSDAPGSLLYTARAQALSGRWNSRLDGTVSKIQKDSKRAELRIWATACPSPSWFELLTMRPWTEVKKVSHLLCHVR